MAAVTNANVASATTSSSPDKMEGLTALRRFCCLGSLRPIYMHLRKPLKIDDYWPSIQTHFQNVNEEKLVSMLREILNNCPLFRRDETMFVYAAYMISDTVPAEKKIALRLYFPYILKDDEDLFLFCKYYSLIARKLNRNGFSRTVRKAIKRWYEKQTPDELFKMWSAHRGLHGFTHKALIKLCNITDKTLGVSPKNSLIFQKCSDVLKADDKKTEEEKISEDLKNKLNLQQAEQLNNNKKKNKKKNKNKNKKKAAPNAENVATSSQQQNSASTSANAVKVIAKPAEKTVAPTKEKNKSSDKSVLAIIAAGKQLKRSKYQSSTIPVSDASKSLTLAMSKLHTTKTKNEAVRIVRENKLQYNQVPLHFLKHPIILQYLIPNMNYMQLLKCWRDVNNYKVYNNQVVQKIFQTILDDKKDLLRNIHPIHAKINIERMGLHKHLIMSLYLKFEKAQNAYLQEMFGSTLKWSSSKKSYEGSRMLITMNLQDSYRKKLLKNHKNMSYADAAFTISYGYFMREKHVDAYHWTGENMKLQQLAYKKPIVGQKNVTEKQFIDAAKLAVNSVENKKNSQRLVAPILHALADKKNTYDVFLCIVPSAGRGNPKNNSTFLSTCLKKYRSTRNPKAKFVILNLMRFKPSMKYCDIFNEHILEICGLDEYTTGLIDNFVNQRFD